MEDRQVDGERVPEEHGGGAEVLETGLQPWAARAAEAEEEEEAVRRLWQLALHRKRRAVAEAQVDDRDHRD